MSYAATMIKAIIATAVAFFGALAAALAESDGGAVSMAGWVTIASATLVAGSLVFSVPNAVPAVVGTVEDAVTGTVDGVTDTVGGLLGGKD